MMVVRPGAGVALEDEDPGGLGADPHLLAHRGPWIRGLLPAGLVAWLQHDALAEGVELALIDRALAYRKLAGLAAAAD